MKKSNIFCSLFVVLLCVFSCSNDSEDDLVDSTPSPTLITYVDNVKSIIDNNCIVCHSNPPVNGAPMKLTTYNDVKNNISNIIDRISRQNGEAGLMPNGGQRLPQAQIDIIIQWQSDGLLEQ